MHMEVYVDPYKITDVCGVLTVTNRIFSSKISQCGIILVFLY
jgi:hypothetical protein